MERQNGMGKSVLEDQNAEYWGVKGKRNGYGEVAFRERTSLSKEGEGKRLKNFMERSNSGIRSLGKCY